MTTPLEERMKLHQPGQLTWPEPELKRKCFACAHFTTDTTRTHRKKLPGSEGICTLCYQHGIDKPVPFRPSAIACPQFKAS